MISTQESRLIIIIILYDTSLPWVCYVLSSVSDIELSLQLGVQRICYDTSLDILLSCFIFYDMIESIVLTSPLANQVTLGFGIPYTLHVNSTVCPANTARSNVGLSTFGGTAPKTTEAAQKGWWASNLMPDMWKRESGANGIIIVFNNMKLRHKLGNTGCH